MAYGATFHKSARTLAEPGAPFVYTPENRARFDEIVPRYPPDRRRSAVLPALYLVQHQQGYITANAMRYVAGLLGITAADVEDVVSYYTMFYTKPVGRFVLSVCRTLSCALNGAERVTEEICDGAGHQAGRDRSRRGTFTLHRGRVPRRLRSRAGRAWSTTPGRSACKPEDVPKLLDDLRTRGEAALTGCHHVVEKR